MSEPKSSLLKQFKLTEIQSRPHCNMTKCIHLDIYVLLSIKRFSVIFNENNNRKAKITIFRASNNEVTSPAVTRLRLYVACESVSLFLSWNISSWKSSKISENQLCRPSVEGDNELPIIAAGRRSLLLLLQSPEHQWSGGVEVVRIWHLATNNILSQL